MKPGKVDFSNIDQPTLCYIAGFFDGEGSIYFTNRRAAKRPHLRISVDQTRPSVIQWIVDQFGGSVSTNVPSIPRKNGEPRRVVWMWQASGWLAAEILKVLLPYFRVKGPEAKIALKVQEMVDGLKWDPTGSRLAEMWKASDSLKKYREDLRDPMFCLWTKA